MTNELQLLAFSSKKFSSLQKSQGISKRSQPEQCSYLAQYHTAITDHVTAWRIICRIYYNVISGKWTRQGPQNITKRIQNQWKIKER